MNPALRKAILDQSVQHLRTKQFEVVEKTMLQMLGQNPSDLDCLLLFAKSQEGLKKYALCVKSYHELAIRSNPPNLQAFEEACRIAKEKGAVVEGFYCSEAYRKVDASGIKADKYALYFARAIKLDVLAKKLGQSILSREPENQEVKYQLAMTLNQMGEIEASNQLLLECATAAPENQEYVSRYLFGLNYKDNVSAAEIAEAHIKWGSSAPQHDSPLSLKSEPPYKIALLSKDLQQHSVAYFALPLIEAIRTLKEFEVHCYSDSEREDEVSQHFKNKANAWTSVIDLSNTELRQKILSDEIDILLDLSGHTDSKRIALFAERAAPIQATYIGYPNTSGLASMDYRIVDEWTDPIDIPKSWHTERLLRLPGGFLCFHQLSQCPEVTDAPSLKNGYVTFGSFNMQAKISDQTLRLWSQILSANPSAKLLLKGRLGLTDVSQKYYLEKLGHFGIEADRILLKGQTHEIVDHLKIYEEVDIHLDSFPYHGTTTTCEAAWQGVPTVTLCGDSHRSRVGNSLLNQLELSHLVASSEESYVKIASDLAKDVEALNSLRQLLRERMAKSQLMDVDRYRLDLQDVFSSMIQTSHSS